MINDSMGGLFSLLIAIDTSGDCRFDFETRENNSLVIYVQKKVCTQKCG